MPYLKGCSLVCTRLSTTLTRTKLWCHCSSFACCLTMQTSCSFADDTWSWVNRGYMCSHDSNMSMMSLFSPAYVSAIHITHEFNVTASSCMWWMITAHRDRVYSHSHMWWVVEGMMDKSCKGCIFGVVSAWLGLSTEIVTWAVSQEKYELDICR
jgi:hypothetical protein